MGRILKDFPNTTPSGGDYEFDQIKDNPGDNTGTPYNEFVYGDMHQLFSKLFEKAGITSNGLPDNTYTGYQYFEALRKWNYKSYTARISQAGTNAPTGSIMGWNDIGPIVWARTTTGTYTATLANAFPASYTVCFVSGIVAGGSAIMVQTNVNTVTLITYSGPSTPSDSVLNGVIEIRVYNQQDGSF